MDEASTTTVHFDVSFREEDQRFEEALSSAFDYQSTLKRALTDSRTTSSLTENSSVLKKAVYTPPESSIISEVTVTYVRVFERCRGCKFLPQQSEEGDTPLIFCAVKPKGPAPDFSCYEQG